MDSRVAALCHNNPVLVWIQGALILVEFQTFELLGGSVDPTANSNNNHCKKHY